MNYTRLEQHIIDVIKEEQVKLGYRSEIIHLYYPLESLGRLIGQDCTIPQMHEQLKSFCDEVKDRLGDIQVTNNGNRFCFTIPPQGADYVHEHTEKNDFLISFIDTISTHGCTLQDIINTFLTYSSNICIEKMQDEDFDYLIYFTDGIPNEYRYCITFEEFHVIYHRFTIEDYRDFGFLPGIPMSVEEALASSVSK